MTSKAISKAFDLLAGRVLSGRDAVPLEGTYRLDGAYRVAVAGGAVEIECLDTASLLRSVIYAMPGRDMVVRVPCGDYRFWLRPLGHGELSRLTLSPMGIMDKARFLVVKAWEVLRRGDAVAVGLSLLRGRVGADRPGSIQAARVPGVGQEVQAWPAVGRAPLEPVVSPRDLAVSIIIPTKERVDLLKACIESLAMVEDVPYEVVVIDNGATGAAMLAYLADLSRRENVQVARWDIPFNFAKLCNEGARLARHPVLLFLNDDVEAQDGHWLSAMRDFAARQDVGIVGARLLYPSDQLQHAGIATNLIPGPGHPWRDAPRTLWEAHPLLAQAGDVDAVTGACLMVRKTTFERVGGFDEVNFAIALNDVDLCLKVRALGLRIVYAPQATLWHKESQTRQADQAPQEIERYRRELAAFYSRHEAAARVSVFYPHDLRRDTDAALLP